MTDAEETKRAGVEARLRSYFDTNVRFAPDGDESRFVLWARLPGATERTRLEPSILRRVFEVQTADEVFEIARSIVQSACDTAGPKTLV